MTIRRCDQASTFPLRADWRMRTILQYRVQRKRAMQVAMDKIAAHLGFQQDGAEHGGDNTEL